MSRNATPFREKHFNVYRFIETRQEGLGKH